MDAVLFDTDGRKHFKSMADVCAPIREWVEARVGPLTEVDPPVNPRVIVATSGRVTVKASVDHTGVRWSVGLDGRLAPCGATLHGVDLDLKCPPAVELAVFAIHGGK